MVPERDQKKRITAPSYLPGNCFLSAVMIYVHSFHCESTDLLKFTWFFSYDTEDEILYLIDRAEIEQYLYLNYGIELIWKRDFIRETIAHDIQNCLDNGQIVGITIDYRKCDWTKKNYQDSYVFHFILLVGSEKDSYLCIDNESKKVVTINKALVHESMYEMVLFDEKKETKKRDVVYENPFSVIYLNKREWMMRDLRKMIDTLLTNPSKENIFFWSSKFKLISSNYLDFSIYLKEKINDSLALSTFEDSARLYQLLSVYCLKMINRDNETIRVKVEEIYSHICSNEEIINRILKGKLYEQ